MTLSALNRKLFRDLWAVRGQVIAIALVLAGGIATYVMAASTLRAMRDTQTRMYREFRFPDLFASLKRAPLSLASRVRQLPGIIEVETRTAAPANISLAGFSQPVSGLIIGLPASGPILNLLHLHAGRLPDPNADHEAIVSDGFAQAHKLNPGFRLEVTIEGRRQTLTVVGIVSTPEFTYQIAPGSLVPDFTTYCILWMNAKPLQASFRMTGAFNQIAATVSPGFPFENLFAPLDSLLRPYGGLGAHARKEQVSHRFLTEEFKQLEMMATLFPAMFLSVAAFLLNVVVGRLMTTQRSQIATLKAFGYTTSAIAWHFLKFTLLIVAIGAVIGIAGGFQMGSGMARLYKDVYRFPYLEYGLDWRVTLFAFAISALAAMTGALFAVLKASAESPAVAMQPANPGHYRRAWLEFPGLSQPSRMILRNILRRPVKCSLSLAGIALSTAILVLGGFWIDAVDFMVFAQLRRAQTEDLAVTFFGPVSSRALYSLRSIPGVTLAEPSRTVSARIRFEHRSFRTGLQGLEPSATLRRLLDDRLQPFEVPSQGLLLTGHLATMLGAKPGDLITVELLEGSRAIRTLPLTATVNEYIGISAYMRRDALNRFLRESDVTTSANLRVDPNRLDSVYSRLRCIPAIAGIAVRSQALQSFYKTLAAQMLTFAFFNTILAGTIAVGVVYNTVRIALSERSRELASLRVLGYTRGEVAYILLGELALVVFSALPLGLWLGRQFSAYFASTAQTELFRIPVVVAPGTYAFSALVILLSTLLSAFIVGRQVNHLDLVEVLKARE